MLRNLAELRRHTVTATDGDVGTVVDFLFDDEDWAIRYLIVNIGGFLRSVREVRGYWGEAPRVGQTRDATPIHPI